ncbi:MULTISPECIES: hypothetical protein [Anaerolinea]|nr:MULTISPECIES: hypothetical protein [Anaerolinea]
MMGSHGERVSAPFGGFGRLSLRHGAWMDVFSSLHCSRETPQESLHFA